MIYAYAQITVKDPTALAEYRDVAGAALAKHGGAIVQASTEHTLLDGAPEIPTASAVMSFPDKTAAQAWANDPELVDVHALRNKAGKSDIVLLG